MTSELHANGRTLRIERDVIEVTTNAPRPDEAWHFTDTNGHEHYWRDGWPTLEWIVDESGWCQDCQDEHEEGHWACRRCGESVDPAMRPASGYREFIPGLTTAYIDDIPATAEEVERFIAEARSGA